MAVHVSGTPIDLTDIQTEFGGVAPIGLSEYYRSGAYVTSNTTGIPTTGAISLSQFYGATGQLSFNISTSTNSGLNLRTAAVAAGWDGVTPVVLTVTPSTWIHRTLTIDGSWPNGVSLINSGKITGTGGGGGGAGQPAITIATTDAVSITNSSGAYIAGGGGGGAGSQGGGGAGQANAGLAGYAGGAYSTSTGISSSFGPYGCSENNNTFYLSGGCSVTVSGSRGAGGQQGASAGSGTTTGGCCTTVFSGSDASGSCSSSITQTICGGGGSPNQGGEGGSILSASQNATVSGGGWGLAGAGGGGAGGAAISGSATFTNNGTVYGSV